MTNLEIAIPEPTGVEFPVSRVCSDIVAWAQTANDVDAIKQARAKLEAIDLYLARTSMSGRAEVAATMRRLEVRIGQLIGPAEIGTNQHREPSVMTEGSADDGLSKDERSEFRRMASEPELVEAVIAQSTDQKPASRRQVLAAIPTGKMKAAVREREDRIRELAAEGHTAAQIAGELRLSEGGVKDICIRAGITLTANIVVNKARRLNSEHILTETASALEGLIIGIGLVNLADVTAETAASLTDSFSSSLRILNRLNKQLKEKASDGSQQQEYSPNGTSEVDPYP